ncbi:hypothetical protein [Bifidobacterium aemilianum]|nr:hypothetical protein [Bifidobacterium aemilianum]
MTTDRRKGINHPSLQYAERVRINLERHKDQLLDRLRDPSLGAEARRQTEQALKEVRQDIATIRYRHDFALLRTMSGKYNKKQI